MSLILRRLMMRRCKIKERGHYVILIVSSLLAHGVTFLPKIVGILTKQYEKYNFGY